MFEKISNALKSVGVTFVDKLQSAGVKIEGVDKIGLGGKKAVSLLDRSEKRSDHKDQRKAELDVKRESAQSQSKQSAKSMAARDAKEQERRPVIELIIAPELIEAVKEQRRSLAAQDEIAPIKDTEKRSIGDILRSPQNATELIISQSLKQQLQPAELAVYANSTQSLESVRIELQNKMDVPIAAIIEELAETRALTKVINGEKLSPEEEAMLQSDKGFKIILPSNEQAIEDVQAGIIDTPEEFEHDRGPELDEQRNMEPEQEQGKGAISEDLGPAVDHAMGAELGVEQSMSEFSQETEMSKEVHGYGLDNLWIEEVEQIKSVELPSKGVAAPSVGQEGPGAGMKAQGSNVEALMAEGHKGEKSKIGDMLKKIINNKENGISAQSEVASGKISERSR